MTNQFPISPQTPLKPFQKRVLDWLMECFSMDVCRDGQERNHRFLEEALELVQSLGCTASEAHQLVDYVFGREVGEPMQELGGVQVTLAALCFPNDLDMVEARERELARVWTKIDKIRAKQAAKPKHSPLPVARSSDESAGVREALALAVRHIEHMAAFITEANSDYHCGTYSFESLGEDLPGIKAALALLQTESKA